MSHGDTQMSQNRFDRRDSNPRNTLLPLVGLLAMAFVQFSGVTDRDPSRAYGSYVLYNWR
jgi:hypothetical protein